MMPGETGQTLRPLNLGNYSVRLIDTNGCEGDMSAMQFYNSIGLEEQLIDLIKLFPNPTTGIVSLELSNLELDLIRVIDGRGRVVSEMTSCNNNCQIDLSEYQDGLYQFLFVTSSGSQVSKSVILQK
jgi:hypothetical protein